MKTVGEMERNEEGGENESLKSYRKTQMYVRQKHTLKVTFRVFYDSI